MHRVLVALGLLAACGGGAGTAPDAGAAIPLDHPDDTVPYQLAPDCNGLVTWTLPDGVSTLGRVAALGRSEAWVIADHLVVPEGGGVLLHLRADGTVAETGWEGVHDVWTCEGEVWATGRAGLLLRRSGAAPDFEVVPLATTADLLSGFGCAGELWLAAGDHAVIRRDDASETVAIEVDVGDVWPLRVHGAGSIRVATEYYGGVLEYDPGAEAFHLAGGTDDIITDAYVRRDGTGVSLHGGYGLRFDPAMPFMHEIVEGLVANRVSRRADDDAWFVSDAVATHLTTGGLEAVALPGSYGDDVDARSDGVWVVGFDGASISTEAGFCPVAPTR